MAYALTVRAAVGKSTLYAQVTDKETGLVWDQTNSVWAALPTGTNANVALTESSDKGYYTGSAGLTPAPGGLYQISVLDSAVAAYLFTTLETYPSKTKTVLQVVNAVQQKLRMPQSAALNDSLALLILGKMNDVLLNLLPQKNVFDHLKTEGTFTLLQGLDYFRFAPANVVGIDRITRLQKAKLSHIHIVDDQKLKSIKAQLNVNTAFQGEPSYARISSRDGGLPILELSCKPDTTYTVSYEAIKTAQELLASVPTGYVPLPDVVQAGALMLMKQEQGRDATAEAGIYGEALAHQATAGANSDMGDVEV